MSDKITQYFDAYYGTPIPESKAHILREPFVKMINTIQADIENHIPNASQESVKAGLLEALQYMNTTGQLETPTLYLNNTRIATDAFRYAIAAANGKPLKRDRTPKEAAAALAYEREATKASIDAQRKEDEEMAKTLAGTIAYIRVNTPLLQLCEKQPYHERQTPNDSSAKVKAYIALLDWWENQGGVDYYIVAWKIPQEQGIYDTQEVIDAQNAHYALPNREGQTRMRVNGKKWDGLK